MKIMVLKGSHLYRAVQAGSAELMSAKDNLNQINVFPVADGDTGSNLSATMRGILNALIAHDDLSIVAKSMADGALSGSSGQQRHHFRPFFARFCQ